MASAEDIKNRAIKETSVPRWRWIKRRRERTKVIRWLNDMTEAGRVLQATQEDAFLAAIQRFPEGTITPVGARIECTSGGIDDAGKGAAQPLPPKRGVPIWGSAFAAYVVRPVWKWGKRD